jgi:hypothetical protein
VDSGLETPIDISTYPNPLRNRAMSLIVLLPRLRLRA